MKVELLKPLATARGTLEVGEQYECASRAEAQRMIKAGTAKVLRQPRQTTMRKRVDETR